ncbi:hypothetical protein ABL78_8370 [Leptomonas seymouri]|uniref:Uncharacterized protein n=1 Tax=Leptomonas seymouri TaxID=5684 RepID=A0A0N1PAP9_LEPSE|nr:hypothetical protein ABL78_8370 [Leptomonas seymouri]|eukprot:KPI82620.1 hypothetical protein ABL78_8370 [Leptomonas seymouri]
MQQRKHPHRGKEPLRVTTQFTPHTWSPAPPRTSHHTAHSAPRTQCPFHYPRSAPAPHQRQYSETTTETAAKSATTTPRVFPRGMRSAACSPQSVDKAQDIGCFSHRSRSLGRLPPTEVVAVLPSSAASAGATSVSKVTLRDRRCNDCASLGGAIAVAAAAA